MSGTLFERAGSRTPENPLRTRLGRRLLGWLLFLSLAPLLGSNMLGYLVSTDIVENLIRRDLAAIANVEAQHVRDQVSRLLLGLEVTTGANETLYRSALASSRAGSSSGPAEGSARRTVAASLGRKLEEWWEFDALYLQRADGGIAVATDELDDDVRRLPSDSGPVEGIHLLETRTRRGQPRFRLLAPVFDADYRAVGYLGGVMGPRGFGGLLEIPAHLAGSIESFIVDEAGRPFFVSHPHGSLDPRAALATPLLGLERGTFERYTDRQGVDVFGIAVPIDGVPWTYIVEFPVEAAFGPLYRLRRISLVFGSAFAALLAVTAFFVSGGIVAPIRRLAKAVGRVGRGDLKVRVESRSRDEIGELEGAFNQMTADLAGARDRIDELHRREIERAGRLATVGELASGVAHEIKNPLVGVSNGLDLVRRRIGEREELTPILEEMSRQLSRMEMAVRDLLAFARPPTPTLVRADPNEIAERALRLIEPAAERARVRVSFEPDPSVPRVPVDPELIRGALVNLLMNAVQATEAGGHVSLSTAGDGEQVRFDVADDGKGIPAGELTHIFKPFFTTRHSGSGLGLSISREIVERHGGRIDVESAVGHGSTFTLRVPVEPEPVAAGSGGDT